MTSFFTQLIQKFQVVIYRTDTLTTDKSNVLSTEETWDFSTFPTIVLDVTLDGGPIQNIVIDSSLFSDSSAATASEVVSQINAQISGGFSIEDGKHRIVLATNTIGDSGSIVVGGAAGTLLGFSSEEVSGGSYDSVWGAPIPTVDGTQTGSNSRRERAPITQLCQLDREGWGNRTLTAGGESDKADIVIVLRKDHLESAGLMDSNGLPHLHVGDRIDRILQKDGKVSMIFPNPPGMWISEVEPAGYGLSFFGTPEINLFYIHCEKDRKIETE